MKIKEIRPQANWILSIIAEDNRAGDFNVAPYLEFEAFAELKNIAEFQKITNGGYFIEWECGADLSADTIEAHWNVAGKSISGRALRSIVRSISSLAHADNACDFL
jgi:hypothetical protein